MVFFGTDDRRISWRNIFAGLIALSVITALTACDGDDKQNSNQTDPAQHTEPTAPQSGEGDSDRPFGTERDNVLEVVEQTLASDNARAVWDGQVLRVTMDGSATAPTARTPCLALSAFLLDGESAIISYPDGDFSCASENVVADGIINSASSAAADVAELSLPVQTASFALAHCSISQSDGGTDVLAHGPSMSGEQAYLSVDLIVAPGNNAGGARIDLGVTSQFESSDEFYVFDFAIVGDGFASVAVSDNYAQVSATFKDEHGADVGTGTLEITCA